MDACEKRRHCLLELIGPILVLDQSQYNFYRG